MFGAVVVLIGAMQFVRASHQSSLRHVNPYQPFEMSLHETVQVGDYPLNIEYQAIENIQCFTVPCPGPTAYIVFHHPFSTYTATFTNNQTRSYKTAHMVVSNIDADSITVYLSASELPHPAGTNIKTPDGTVWFINSVYQRQAYTSAGAFLSYGFNNFSSVVNTNASDYELMVDNFIPPADGKIICSDRGFDRGTCYLISQGDKAGFTSEAVFTGLGYKFSRALYGDVSFLPTSGVISDSSAPHRDGTLINRQGTVAYVYAGGYLSFPSIEVFNSWGFSFEDVVPANKADSDMYSFGLVSPRRPGELKPY